MRWAGVPRAAEDCLQPQSTLRMLITGPEALATATPGMGRNWLHSILLHPWDGLELATLNADGLKLDEI